MAGEVSTTYHIQRGSSNTIRVSDGDAWYVIEEIWEGSRILNSRAVGNSYNREEMVALLRRIERLDEPMWLCDLAKATGILHDTLRLALNEGRLEGHKEGGRWQSTIGAVREAIDAGTMRFDGLEVI